MTVLSIISKMCLGVVAAESYLGEQVTMAQHMLQTAQCAELAGADDSQIVAALLHDIGHYKNEISRNIFSEGY